MGRIAGAQFPVEGLQESATIAFGISICVDRRCATGILQAKSKSEVGGGGGRWRSRRIPGIGIGRRVDEIVLALRGR